MWSIPSAGGEARKIRAGNRVIAAPTGKELLVNVLDSPNMRLFRVPLDGGAESEVPVDPSHALADSSLAPGSWKADGRLLIGLHDSWFTGPALLDTATGRVQPLPFDGRTDYGAMSWTPDGRIMALRGSMRSPLWHFSPGKE